MIHKLHKAVVFLLAQILWRISPPVHTRYICRYYARHGCRILGQPNYIAATCSLDGTDYSLIELNEGCTVSGDVRILTHDWALTTAARGLGIAIDAAQPVGRFEAVRIGRYAFFGTRSILLPGADVGDCAIVGAGTVVRGVVPPYAIVIGNPWKKVGDTRDYVAQKLPGGFGRNQGSDTNG